MSLLAGRSRFPYLNIVLLGKTGSGKSCTGNSLLCKNAFRTQTSNSFESVTKTLEFSQTTDQIVMKQPSESNPDVNSMQLRIYDTPGFFDADILEADTSICNNFNAEIARLSRIPGSRAERDQVIQKLKAHREAAKERRKEAVREEVLRCVIKSCSESGIHAFLYVIRYRDRIDQSQLDTLYEIEKTFGAAESSFFDYLFVVITQKDLIEKGRLSESDVVQQLGQTCNLPIVQEAIEDQRYFCINNKLLKIIKNGAKYPKHHRDNIEMQLKAQRDALIGRILHNIDRKNGRIFTTADFEAIRECIDLEVAEEIQQRAPYMRNVLQSIERQECLLDRLEAEASTISAVVPGKSNKKPTVHRQAGLVRPLTTTATMPTQVDKGSCRSDPEQNAVAGESIVQKYKLFFEQKGIIAPRMASNMQAGESRSTVAGSQSNQQFRETEHRQEEQEVNLVDTGVTNAPLVQVIQEPTTSASVDSSPTSACNEAKIYPKSPEMQNENMRPMKTLLQQQIKQLETSRKQHEYEIEVAQGRLQQSRTYILDMKKYIQNAMYELGEKHKDRMASSPKLFFVRVTAGAKGLFKLRPKKETQKAIEQHNDRLEEEAQQKACAEFKARHPMWNRDLAASESQLLQIQNDIQKRKEICSEIFSQEIELKREIEEIDFSNDSRLVSNRSSVRMQGNNDPNPIHDDSRGDFDSFSEDDQH